MRNDNEIIAFDRWRVEEGRQHHPDLALPDMETRLDKRSCRYVEAQSQEYDLTRKNHRLSRGLWLTNASLVTLSIYCRITRPLLQAMS